ncbi:MAG: MaoC family dehydratase, partial [Acidimicrobiales bacterium]
MTATERWGAIDDQSIDEARELLGVPLRRDRMQWNKVATRDAIRQFTLGAGDDNPLWTDDAYAAATRWGGLLAPPSFLYAVDATIVAPRLPGVQWIYAGTRWRWYDVIRRDDVFDVGVVFTELEEKEGRRFGKWVLQKGEIVYRRDRGDDDGALICVAQGRVARTPRRTKKNKTTSTSAEAKSDPALSQVEEEPVASFAPEVTRESRRGRVPRFWEECEIGETIGPVALELTLDGIFSWYTGAQGALHYGGAHGDAVRYRHR